MKALRLTAWQRPPALVDIPTPEPKAGEVLIKIAGAGACHSDLHVMEWPAGQLPWQLPFTLGHENAGWVETLGAGVSGYSRGDAVLVYGPWGCGRCHACSEGRENYCERSAELGVAGGGLGRDGGMAEYMIVPSARWLVPLGKLEALTAAPLADAALTPYHAIAQALPRLDPTSTAVIIGAGGLGQMAIALLRALSAVRIIVVDKAATKRARAERLGADLALGADATTAKKIRDATAGKGAGLVLDVVGAEATLALGAALLAPEGTLTIVGLAMGTLPVSFFSIPYGATVRTSYWGTLPELHEVVALATAHRIAPEVETFPLARGLEVYERLRAGKILGRAVLVP